MYKASSNPAASTASNSHSFNDFPLTFSIKIPITSVLADL